jgi:hypothetical protein
MARTLFEQLFLTGLYDLLPIEREEEFLMILIFNWDASRNCFP